MSSKRGKKDTKTQCNNVGKSIEGFSKRRKHFWSQAIRKSFVHEDGKTRSEIRRLDKVWKIWFEVRKSHTRLWSLVA